MKLASFHADLVVYAEKGKLCEKLDILDGPKVADIDSNHNDMLMCSLYAPDIYKNLSVTEVCCLFLCIF